MSNLILYIGHTGMGKTTRVKKALKASKKNKYIFDVNNEYNDYNREIDADFRKFMDTAKTLTDSDIVFEDATGYLTGKTADEMRKLIVAKRHTRNNIIMLFHSISSVPPFIFQLANWIVLLKTSDELKTVKTKKENLINPFMKLRSTPMMSNKEGAKFSPSIQIKNI